MIYKKGETDNTLAKLTSSLGKEKPYYHKIILTCKPINKQRIKALDTSSAMFFNKQQTNLYINCLIKKN